MSEEQLKVTKKSLCDCGHTYERHQNLFSHGTCLEPPFRDDLIGLSKYQGVYCSCERFQRSFKAYVKEAIQNHAMVKRRPRKVRK